jgi:hypothetical protein
MKDFKRKTAAKANGEYRLLLVNGHNSHYTRGFLKHARTHQVLVLCYPAHTTHIYQGLDVVVFSVLKKHLSEERDHYERMKGETISKSSLRCMGELTFVLLPHRRSRLHSGKQESVHLT